MMRSLILAWLAQSLIMAAIAKSKANIKASLSGELAQNALTYSEGIAISRTRRSETSEDGVTKKLDPAQSGVKKTRSEGLAKSGTRRSAKRHRSPPPSGAQSDDGAPESYPDIMEPAPCTADSPHSEKCSRCRSTSSPTTNRSPRRSRPKSKSGSPNLTRSNRRIEKPPKVVDENVRNQPESDWEAIDKQLEELHIAVVNAKAHYLQMKLNYLRMKQQSVEMKKQQKYTLQ